MTKYKISLWVITSLIVIIFVLSFINYISVNTNVNHLLEIAHAEQNFSLSLPEDKYNNVQDMREIYYKNLFHNLEETKKDVFDSNTITFLVSFTLSLLFTILLTLQNKLYKQNVLIEKALQKINNEKIIQRYHTRLQGLHCAAMLYHEIIIRDNYQIQPTLLNIVYIIDREVTSLLKEIPENKSFLNNITIDKKDRDSLNRIIYNIIHLISLERIRRNKINTCNSMRSIEDLQQNMLTLDLRLKNIPIDKNDEKDHSSFSFLNNN